MNGGLGSKSTDKAEFVVRLHLVGTLAGGSIGGSWTSPAVSAGPVLGSREFTCGFLFGPPVRRMHQAYELAR